MKTTTSDAVRKEQLHAAMERLETAVREMFESGRFHEYLTMLSRFHNYSFNNILLAWCQNPNISHLASYQTWKKQKMQVRKGEKAIKILCPIPYKYHAERNRTNEDGEIEKEIIAINGVRFRLGNVFDISQCDGELDSIVKVPTDNSEELHRAVQQLMDSEDQIMYDPDLTGSSANGFFSPVTGEIHIKEGMSDLQTFRCILHEQAHSLLHGEDDSIRNMCFYTLLHVSMQQMTTYRKRIFEYKEANYETIYQVLAIHTTQSSNSETQKVHYSHRTH